MQIEIARVQQPAEEHQGFRVLVDRLWPRGISKVRAALDLWAKQISPSSDLRHQVHHEDLPWDDFVTAYTAELTANPELEDFRREIGGHDTVVLLTSVKDPEHSDASVLRDFLQR